MSASNPIFRDTHEYCLCFSKGRWQRVRKGKSTITKEEFLEATLSVWDILPESANRVGHPAPFPIALPRRFIELFFGGAASASSPSVAPLVFSFVAIRPPADPSKMT